MKAIIIIIISLLLLGLACQAQFVPKDKQLHLYGGVAIGAWSTRLTLEQDGWKPLVYGLSVPIVIGAGKELVDLAGAGTPEFADFGYTVIGAVIGVGIIYGIKAIVKRHRTRIGKYSRINPRHCGTYKG